MVSVDSDITKFNKHVKTLLLQLHARNATTQDLLANLFKAYKVVSDKDFVQYIKTKKIESDEGMEVSPEKLMLMAESMFKTMKQDKEWNAPTPEQEEILALKAQVEKLKKSKANKSDPPSKDNKEPKKNKNQRKNIRKAKWKLIPPKEGEKHKKFVANDSKPWHWCGTHEAWVRHLPSACEGKGWRPPNKRKVSFKEDDKPDETQAPPSKKLKVAKALASILEEDDE